MRPPGSACGSAGCSLCPIFSERLYGCGVVPQRCDMVRVMSSGRALSRRVVGAVGRSPRLVSMLAGVSAVVAFGSGAFAQSTGGSGSSSNTWTAPTALTGMDPGSIATAMWSYIGGLVVLGGIIVVGFHVLSRFIKGMGRKSAQTMS